MTNEALSGNLRELARLHAEDCTDSECDVDAVLVGAAAEIERLRSACQGALDDIERGRNFDADDKLRRALDG